MKNKNLLFIYFSGNSKRILLRFCNISQKELKFSTWSADTQNVSETDF